MTVLEFRAILCELSKQIVIDYTKGLELAIVCLPTQEMQPSWATAVILMVSNLTATITLQAE